jgi:predicted DNA-binding ribbon-helix-helix protein
MNVSPPGAVGAEGRGSTFIDPDIFVCASKRSITIAGHATSIRIESPFWDALVSAAAERRLPISALVAQIDAARLLVNDPPNLASAIRLWVLDLYRQT